MPVTLKKMYREKFQRLLTQMIYSSKFYNISPEDAKVIMKQELQKFSKEVAK